MTKFPTIRRLLISATCKGGVGRSFFLVNLADWLNELEQSFLFLDSDACNGTLTRFYPDSRYVNLEDPESASREVMAALEESELVAWDAVGGRIHELPSRVESLLVAAENASIRITVVLMVEEDKDTVFQAGEMARELGSRVDWLVVKNLKTCSTTEIYDHSKARQELLRLDAVEITMERVPWSLLATIQRTSCSLSSLVLDESLPFLERQRLRTFQKRLFEQLETARRILLPMKSQTASDHRPEQPPTAFRPRVAPEEV